MATLEERVGHLEGAYEHLATKADIETLRTEIEKLRTDLSHTMAVHLRWMIGIQLSGLAALAAVLRLLG